MWSKIIIISCCALFLISCGFQPLLKDSKNTGDPQKISIKIKGSGYSAYKFRRELEKLLALSPKIDDRPYILVVSLNEGAGFSYAQDASIARSQSTLKASYSLERSGDKTPLKTGVVDMASSYSHNAAAEFATLSSQTKAKERIITALAEDLSREVLIAIRSQG